MVKNKDHEALRQRNIRRKKKHEFDKYKAFYTYVFMQDPEIVLSFEDRQSEERQVEEVNMTCINDFNLYLSNN